MIYPHSADTWLSWWLETLRGHRAAAIITVHTGKC
jgi:hypothetical protein